MHQHGSAVRTIVILAMVTATLLSSGCSLFMKSSQPQRRVMLSPHKATDHRSDMVAFSSPADLRLSFLREENSLMAYCAEPMPDVSLGSDVSGSGSLAAAAALTQSATSEANATLAQQNESLRKDLRDAILAYEEATNRNYTRASSSSDSVSMSGNASINLQAAYRLATTVSELGGRSQQVLLAREFLYRLCEARANGFIRHEQAFITLQNNALRMIQSISAPVRPSASAEQAEFFKRAAEYLKERRALCDARLKLCQEAAKDDAGKKACLSPNQACVDEIETPKLSQADDKQLGASGVDAPANSEFILEVPDITNVAPDPSAVPR